MSTAVMQQPSHGIAAAERARITDPAVLVDLTRCTGCKGCVVSCQEWAGLRHIVPPLDQLLHNRQKLFFDGTTNTAIGEFINAILGYARRLRLEFVFLAFERAATQ